jgi:O-6-methylguanine DNA methyltransferase
MNNVPITAACMIRLGAIELLLLAGESSLEKIILMPDASLRARYGKFTSENNVPLALARGFFRAYMKNEKTSVPSLDISEYSENERKVYRELLHVPLGATITYGELAQRAGFPGAARFAGSCMRKNSFPIIIPCHRVVPSTGGIGHYSPDPAIKKMLLEFERGEGDLSN